MASGIHVVYAAEQPPSRWHASIFLAGPTPRDPQTPSWRPEAIELIRDSWPHPGRLVVFVPEARDGTRYPSYVDQVEWEHTYTEVADVLLFWVPREMSAMPGLTTNVEWGRYENSGRVVLGCPASAVKVSYLKHFAHLHATPVSDSLPRTVELAMGRIGAGAAREEGDREVPLLIWHAPGFQAWRSAQREAGNTLLGGRVAWTSPFYWAYHASIHIGAEDRVKDNEVVLGRPDLNTVVACRPAPDPLDTVVVLVREFRSPSMSADGFVRELPGGSGSALDELREETGLDLPEQRLRRHLSRQPVATLSAHRQHVFSVLLTDDEVAQLRAVQGFRGNGSEGERTYVELHRVGDLLGGANVDWTTLGIIFQVVSELR